ncbi:hypothetical protein IscW_ISCW009522 [Ixodes scapularis]|uniref:Uncharacterized protein n=1 Tax=Ixodes scapularis TaxID=6945 RepID=B7Q0H7_IXOSC|nr:hypothetical protein IscW_ISCW009522 [Ixodes scapularis]|eukprot:XP_002407729.1 hypothetical protein IscW_ISCW009522 [Ixodes scapularis]
MVMVSSWCRHGVLISHPKLSELSRCSSSPEEFLTIPGRPAGDLRSLRETSGTPGILKDFEKFLGIPRSSQGVLRSRPEAGSSRSSQQLLSGVIKTLIVPE